MITFEHVYKHFTGQTNALSDITVDIKDGEFVFLIGPSGAGKTTLLRLIIRDLVPSRGSLIVDDRNINAIPKSKVHLLRRQIGMVFQDFKLLVDRTVFENVSLGPEILGKSEKEIARGVSDVLELVGLSQKRDKFPLQLSAGEMQRASIARALSVGPKYLLADEPTGNLDPQTSWEILQILREVNGIGTTVIMATHNASIVNQLKLRTISLEHGKITGDEAKGHYAIVQKHKRKKEDESI